MNNKTGEGMSEGEVVKLKQADVVAGGSSFGFIKRTGEGVGEGEKALFFSEKNLAPGTTIADIADLAKDTHARVQFEVLNTEKGPIATNVTVISKESGK